MSTSLGTGMMISTLLAMDLDLNWDLVFIMYSILLLLCGSTTASTHIKGFTASACDVQMGGRSGQDKRKIEEIKHSQR